MSIKKWSGLFLNKRIKSCLNFLCLFPVDGGSHHDPPLPCTDDKIGAPRRDDRGVCHHRRRGPGGLYLLWGELSLRLLHRTNMYYTNSRVVKLTITVRSRIFTCVAEGESRSRSAVTPSVRPSVPKSCHRNSSETTDPIIMKLGSYVDRQEILIPHLGVMPLGT